MLACFLSAECDISSLFINMDKYPITTVRIMNDLLCKMGTHTHTQSLQIVEKPFTLLSLSSSIYAQLCLNKIKITNAVSQDSLDAGLNNNLDAHLKTVREKKCQLFAPQETSLVHSMLWNFLKSKYDHHSN